MTEPYIRLQRFPYEEPYHLQLGLEASNGVFQGGFDFYTGTHVLSDLGSRLRNFPSSITDEVSWAQGSDQPEERCYRYLRIRAYVTDARGHCAIQFEMNSNSDEPHEGHCRFSIAAEAASINRLGVLLVRFAGLQHLELYWTPSDGELYSERQKLYVSAGALPP